MSALPELILFDLDGTLYDMRRMKRRLLRRGIRELLAFGPLGVTRRFRALQAFRRAREAHRGQAAVESLRSQLEKQVAAKTGLRPEVIEGAVGEYLYGEKYPELQALRSREDRRVLEILFSRGYKLGVVSEYPVDTKLGALGLGDIPWSARVDCEQVGVLKPDPAVFLEAARRVGVLPERTVVVGDRLDADVLGASQAGMRSVWLTGRDPGAKVRATPDHRIRSLTGLLEIFPRRTRPSS